MRVRFCLMILAMFSLALLPGPAHALAHAHPDVGHTHQTGMHQSGMHQSGMLHRGPHDHDALARTTPLDHHHDHSGHHHGPVCDTACCAPMCSLYAPPTAAATRIGHVLTPPLPTSDRPRPDAATPRSLRPPEPA